jgi:hypothetical protein
MDNILPEIQEETSRSRDRTSLKSDAKGRDDFEAKSDTFRSANRTREEPA